MPHSQNESHHPQVEKPISRRHFLKSTAIASAVMAGGCTAFQKKGPAILHDEHKAEKIRVGLIGCGGRGTGAAKDCVHSSANIEIVALGDAFADRVQQCREWLADLGDAVQVKDDCCFSGFDNYQGVLSCDVDLVILATPPHFRPLHLEAAIAAGKHVFMEKPVGVDPAGIRRVIAAAEQAELKRLAIVSGTQRRHQPHYLETMRRIEAGEIGDLVGAQCYWNQGKLWVKEREPQWSDMEWQIRNWLYFCWLSGDHIVEQHVHNLDVVNWAMGGPPVKCVGMGGRQVRTGPEYGNIFDHFCVEYEYANGARLLSMCRQIEGCSDRVSERIVGSKGSAYTNHSEARIDAGKGWVFEDGGHPVNPYEQEHKDLIASIRNGQPLNEGRRVAESTLTAIMGRMSAYTGRELSWSWLMNASQLDLTPPAYEFGDLPIEPVPVPGETKLV